MRIVVRSGLTVVSKSGLHGVTEACRCLESLRIGCPRVRAARRILEQMACATDPRHAELHRAIVVASIAAAACGGNVIIDEPASGSGGNTSSVGSTATFIPGLSCDELQAELEKLIAAATVCECMLPPCSDDRPIHDTCGCPIAAGASRVNEAKQAEASYQQWIAAGCGPLSCTGNCARPTYWTCNGETDGCAGTCVGFIAY